MTAQFFFWGTGLALAALCAFLPRKNRTVWSLATLAMLPPALLAGCLLSAQESGNFRLKVTGVTVEDAALGEPVTIGGDPAQDDLVFDQLPSRLARLMQDDRGAPIFLIDVRPPSLTAQPGIVEVETEAGRGLIGSEALQAGDAICLDRCERPGARLFRLRADGSGLDADKSDPLPDFQGNPSRAAEQAIYPLRDYATRWRGVDETAARPCEGRFACLSDGTTPVRSFIYRTCASSSCVRVMLLDPNARLIRAGNAVPRHNFLQVSLAGLKRVRIFSVHYSSPYADITESGGPASRLVSRASISPVRDAGTTRLDLGRPESIPIRRASLDDAVGPDGAVSLTLLGHQAAVQADSVLNPIVLDTIGGTLGRTINARLRFDEATGFGRSGTEVDIEGAHGPVRLGAPFTLGQHAPVRVATFTLERLDIPWSAAWIAALWSFFLAAAMRRQWREDGLAPLVIWLIQWLLALRLLIGLESVALDPALGVGEAIGGNIAAYAGLPLFLAAASGKRAYRTDLWPAILFAGGIVLWVWLHFGWSNTLAPVGAALLVAVTVAAAAAMRARDGEARPGLPDRLLAPAKRLGGWFRSLAGAMLARGWQAWVGLVVALLLLRLLLLAGGVRERIDWPFTIAVSIFYVPPLLLALAGLLKGEKDVANGYARPIWFALTVLVALVAVPFLVNDKGLTIYAIAVSALALAVTPRRPFRRWLTWNAPTLFGAALLLAVLGSAWIGNLNWGGRVDSVVAEAQRAPNPEARAEAHRRAAALLASANDDNQNFLRVWTAFAPERIASAGTSEAESQKRVAAILRDYSSSLWGRGYMVFSRLGDIRRYQADDNVSAVHLMSPFGRIGAAILLLILGLFAWRGSRPLRDAHVADLPLPVIVGILTAWTIFALAAYMILSNLQWLPFTGRNIYLLGALSISDLIEGALLFLIVAHGLRIQEARGS